MQRVIQVYPSRQELRDIFAHPDYGDNPNEFPPVYKLDPTYDDIEDEPMDTNECDDVHLVHENDDCSYSYDDRYEAVKDYEGNIYIL